MNCVPSAQGLKQSVKQALLLTALIILLLPEEKLVS